MSFVNTVWNAKSPSNYDEYGRGSGDSRSTDTSHTTFLTQCIPSYFLSGINARSNSQRTLYCDVLIFICTDFALVS